MSEPEGPEDGHTFRISYTSRGSYGVVGQEGHTDAPAFDGPVHAVEVRAWNLRDALTKAATLPFGVLMGEVQCRCGHPAEAHATDELSPLCTVCGDNTHCDYADDETIAADRWDEGWHAAVIRFIPDELGEKERLLWVLEHMPQDNPYRPDEYRVKQ